MNILITYQSKTGFTQRYAEWIAQALSCGCKDASQVTAAEIAGAELVIHGGWIMGGMINGLDKIRAMKPQTLIVFGVGFTGKENMELAKCIETNKLGDTPFFYYEGGMKPKEMGFMGRTMVKMATGKTPVDADHTNRGDIEALVKLAAEMA